MNERKVFMAEHKYRLPHKNWRVKCTAPDAHSACISQLYMHKRASYNQQISQHNTQRDRQTDRQTDGDRETETDRQTDGKDTETNRERASERERETERETDRQTETETETETDRQTERQRHRERRFLAVAYQSHNTFSKYNKKTNTMPQTTHTTILTHRTDVIPSS